MSPRRIGVLWALLIAFVVLMASNSWLKGIFGVRDISGTVPFLLTGLVLFAIWKFNRRGGDRGNTLMGSARFGGRKEARELEKKPATSSSAAQAGRASCCATTVPRIC